MNFAQFLISVLEKVGISDAFSLVGGMAMHVNHSVHCSSIRVTYCNHEQAVVAAAEGYAKADQYARPALAIVTSGPGVTNTITALASAFYDSVPMILISGQVKSADLNKTGVRSFGAQEVPHAQLLAPVTKLTYQISSGDIGNYDLAEVLATAMRGRKGPVHIDVPLDIQSAMTGKSDMDVQEVAEIYFSLSAETSDIDSAALNLLCETLKGAQRPLIVLGNGLKIASLPSVTINSLVERLAAPCLLTWASMDLLDYDHPMVFGCAGGLAGVHSNRILQSADVILFLGVRLDLLTTGFNPKEYGKNARRFIVEIDDAEARKNMDLPNTTTILGDVRALVSALLCTEKLCARQDPSWLVSCQAWRAENDECEKREFFIEKNDCFHLSRAVAGCSSARYVVPTASGFAIEGFARFYKPTRGSRFAWAGHVLGSMGLALPSAIGAARRLNSLVTCVDGDGGFLLNMQELFTLQASRELAIAIIILNNKGYVSIRNSQMRAFGDEFGATNNSGLIAVDFEKIAQLTGLSYAQCNTFSEFCHELEALDDSSRILIDVRMDDDGYRGPAISTKFDQFGRPYSTPLQEVAWR
jgi:acetolactate synthase-1/2/3 large subunit